MSFTNTLMRPSPRQDAEVPFNPAQDSRLQTAGYYRGKAAQMLRLVDESATPGMREHWNVMAVQWERLACQVESQDC